MKASNMNPDQTAPKGAVSDLGPYCLPYRLPKNISRQDEHTTKDVTGELKVNYYYSLIWRPVFLSSVYLQALARMC